MVDIEENYTATASVTDFGLGVLVSVTGAVTTVSGVPQHPDKPMALSTQINQWESLGFSATITTTDNQIDWQSVLTQFGVNMIENSLDPVPDFDAVVSEHFWDLA